MTTPLRVRRADSAPGYDEFFGRTGESAIGDVDLSDAAHRVLAAVYLDIAMQRGKGVSLATNAELGRLCGKQPRTVTRLLRELEARKHVTLEPVRTIAGAPRGIRVLSRLKPARTLTDGTKTPSPEVTRCTSPQLATHMATDGDAPSHFRLPTSPPLASALLRESEREKILEIAPASSSSAVRGPTPTPSRDGETEDQKPLTAEDLALAQEWVRGGGVLGRIGARVLAGATGAGSGPGSIRQDTPGAVLETVPDKESLPQNRPKRQGMDIERNINSIIGD